MAEAGARKPAPRSLMARAVAMLARREHSRTELGRKLAQHLEPEQSEAELTRVLDELERRQLLSDARFAGALVRSRSARYGDARLRQELKQKGVAGEAAAHALETLGESEFARARALWQRRFGAPPASREERARQGRYLQARGFSMATISRVLRAAHDADAPWPDEQDADAQWPGEHDADAQWPGERAVDESAADESAAPDPAAHD